MLPCLQAHKLAYHTFTEAGRRCMRTQGTADSMSFLFTWLLLPPQLYRVIWSCPAWWWATLSSGNPSLLEDQTCSTLFQMEISWTAKKHDACLEDMQKHAGSMKNYLSTVLINKEKPKTKNVENSPLYINLHAYKN